MIKFLVLLVQPQNMCTAPFGSYGKRVTAKNVTILCISPDIPLLRLAQALNIYTKSDFSNLHDFFQSMVVNLFTNAIFFRFHIRIF